jgi:hypothetical protein
MTVYIIRRTPNNNTWIFDNNAIFKDFPSLKRVGNNIINNESLAKTLALYNNRCFNSDNYYNLLNLLNNDNTVIIIGLVKLNNIIASGHITNTNINNNPEKKYILYNLCKYNTTEKKQKKTPVKLLIDKFKDIIIKDLKQKTVYLTVDMKTPLSALILTRLYIKQYNFRLDEYQNMYSVMKFKKHYKYEKNIGKKEHQIIKLYNKFNRNIKQREKLLNYKLSTAEKTELFSGNYEDLFFEIVT